jgi:hypothetical protein
MAIVLNCIVFRFGSVLLFAGMSYIHVEFNAIYLFKVKEEKSIVTFFLSNKNS